MSRLGTALVVESGGCLGEFQCWQAQGGWPRANVSCDFKRPLLTNDRIEVQLAIARLGTSSITWNFEVINAAGATAATGSMTNVRVDHTGKPQEITAAEREALT